MKSKVDKDMVEYCQQLLNDNKLTWVQRSTKLIEFNKKRKQGYNLGPITAIPEKGKTLTEEDIAHDFFIMEYCVAQGKCETSNEPLCR